jgi:hypothetical protein
MIIGVMEDNGLFLGSIKLVGAGGSFSGDISVGMEKSSISLLITIPVEVERIPAPNSGFEGNTCLRCRFLVGDTTKPFFANSIVGWKLE